MQPNFTCSPELTEYAYRDECNNIFMFNGTGDFSPWYQTVPCIAYDQIKFRLRPNSHITDFFRPLKGNLISHVASHRVFSNTNSESHRKNHSDPQEPSRVGMFFSGPSRRKKLSRDLEHFAFPMNMTVRGFTKIIDFKNPFPNQLEINF